MKYGIQLLSRFGLIARRDEAPDAFDLRLQRTLSRERRLVLKRSPFRPLLQPEEA